ncbi:MAG TPA: DUF5985 family protein [Methylophilaceae bacterium]|nr:DUF5985 family protein [Methylophilaceae bacterium]
MVYVIYGLCALTALLCSVLLLRAYFMSRYKLLLWSGLCFAGLTLNNTILMLDKIVFLEGDLLMVRLITALLALFLLLYGLICDE